MGERVSMGQSISFFSTCPTCRYPRLQAGFTPNLLRWYFENNQTLEGYCLSCDSLWPINAQEQAVLARLSAR